MSPRVRDIVRLVEYGAHTAEAVSYIIRLINII